MKTKDILELDCRIQSNQDKIQKVLRQIKPLAKCPENKRVSTQKLERCIKVLCNKYQLYVREFYPDVEAGDTYIIWRATIVDERTLKTICHVYGCSSYECLAKAVIALYSVAKKV